MCAGIKCCFVCIMYFMHLLFIIIYFSSTFLIDVQLFMRIKC